jgi:Ca2+-binding RTX toxin-like protein
MFMPTVIAIESTEATARGVETPFQHLYLVKRVTDDAGNVVQEKVIRGGPGRGDQLVTVADVDLAESPDARGSDTLAQRHHTVLDLQGRDPEAVWSLMVQHAVNINRADLDYSFDIVDAFNGSDLNSNTVVASALHTIGIDLAANLPDGVSRREVPLYDQTGDMRVDDLLRGGNQSDVIYGGAGRDRIEAGDGDNRLFGEVDNDVLIGGVGKDVLDGGSGTDRMKGGLGDDRYYIDVSTDRVIEKDVSLAGGIDRVVSAVSLNLLKLADLAGVEQLALRGSDDLHGRGNLLENTLIGNRGDNVLSGNAGDDILSAHAGKDDLRGGHGNDNLRAGAGDDLLNGGGGQDILSGDSGRDTFVFGSISDSGPDPVSTDLIVDFSTADTIDLRGIDARTTASGNQAFSFIGSATFTGAGQLRYELDGAGNTVVQADVNGDLATDFQVVLQGYTRPLSAGDFIL